MGNPWVFVLISRLRLVNNLYLPKVYGTARLVKVDPRVNPYQYLWQVTHRYAIS